MEIVTLSILGCSMIGTVALMILGATAEPPPLDPTQPDADAAAPAKIPPHYPPAEAAAPFTSNQKIQEP